MDGVNALSVLVIDLAGEKYGPRAYIGGAEGQLIVFCLKDMKWWRLSLRAGNEVLPVYTQFLAVDENMPRLFLTGGKSNDLFSMDLKGIRESPGPLAVEAQVGNKKLKLSEVLGTFT